MRSGDRFTRGGSDRGTKLGDCRQVSVFVIQEEVYLMYIENNCYDDDR